MAVTSDTTLQLAEAQKTVVRRTATGGSTGNVAVLQNEVVAYPSTAGPDRFVVSDTTAPEAEIQSAIDYAASNGGGPVVLGSAVVEGGYDVSQVSFDSSVPVHVAGDRGEDYNVRAYGASGDGSTDDTGAVKAAKNIASAQGGGMVYFPGPYSYLFTSSVDMPTSVGAYGDGWSSEIIGPGFNSGAMRWVGTAEDVVVRDLAFDIASTDDFDSVLKFESSPGPVRVEGCKIFDSNKASQGNWTINAIISQGVDHVTVKHCFGDGVQFKLAGGGLAHQTLRAIGNTVIDATNFGISAVVGDNGSVENVLFANNTVRNFNQGGLYAGRDGDTATGVTTRNIRVVNNTVIAGDRNERSPAFNILVRAGDASSGSPLISQNDCEGFSISGDLFGIQAKSYDNVSILNNDLDGPFTQASIDARNISSGLIRGNEVSDGSGGRIFLDEAGGIFRDNIISGAGTGAPKVDATDAAGLVIKENEFRDFSNGDFDGAVQADSTSGNTSTAQILRNDFADDVGNFHTAVRARNDGTTSVEVRGNDARECTQFFSGSTVVSALEIGENRGLTPDLTLLRRPTQAHAWLVRDVTNTEDLARLLESGKFEVGKVGVGTVADPTASFQTDQDLLIEDSATDPSVNGEFRQNADDVKVYSGGAVRNLSDIRAENRWVRISQETATGYPETAAMVINTNKQRSAWDASDNGIVHMRASLTNFEPEAGRNEVHMWVNFRQDEITYQASAQIDVRLAENGSGESVIVLQDTSTDQQRTTIALDIHVGHNTVADTLRGITIGTETDLSTYTILSSPSQQHLYEEVANPDDTLQGTYQLEGRLSLPKTRTRQSYAPGFTGSGWAIGDNLQKPDAAQLSHLTVRGTLRTFEFLVEQTRVRTGPQAVSPGGGKLEQVSLRTHTSQANTFEQWDITAVDTTGNWVEVDNSTGDTNPLNDLTTGQYVLINGSTGNDENYTVSALSDQGSGITRITFNESLPDATADGVLMEAVRQNWTFENDGGSGMGHGFVNDDRVLAQRFDPDSQTVIAQVRAVVDGVDSRTDARVTVDTDYFVPNTGQDTDGFEFFVVGSARSDRDSFIYDNPYDPSREYLDGISDFDVWDNRADQIRTKVGNLDTRYDYSSEVYGMAAGDPTDVWISADDTKGVRMVDNTSGNNTVRAQLQGSALTLGDTADPHVKIDPTDRGLQMINTQGTEAARLDGTALRLGEEQNEHILIDPNQSGVQMINANGTEVGRFDGSLLRLGSTGQIVFDPSQSPEANIVGTLQMGDGSGNGKIVNAAPDYRLDESGVALNTPFDRVESSSITFFENLGGTEDDVGSLHAESGDQEVVIDTFDLHTDYNIRFSANDYVDVEGVQFLNGALYFINPRPSDIEPGDIPAGTAVLYAREYSDGNINLKWAENPDGQAGSKDEIF